MRGLSNVLAMFSYPVDRTERSQHHLPVFWSLYSAIDTYEYKSGSLLECPIYSFEGDKDSQQKMGSWAMESSSSKSDTKRFPGGSFFHLDQGNEASKQEITIHILVVNETQDPWRVITRPRSWNVMHIA